MSDAPLVAGRYVSAESVDQRGRLICTGWAAKLPEQAAEATLRAQLHGLVHLVPDSHLLAPAIEADDWMLGSLGRY